MSESGILILLLAVAFYFLGKAADLVVVNVKKLGQRLRIKVFFLGILLGFFTSFPEFGIALNAIAENAVSISLGNLLGGILVLFGLVLGGSIILNRRIHTDGNILHFLPISLYILLPVLLGLKGELGYPDGLALIAGYLILLDYLYIRNKNRPRAQHEGKMRNHVFPELLLIAAGLVGVLFISNFIVRFTLQLLQGFQIPVFVVGLLVFSLGTNLPEIIIVFRSWERHITDLSLSNLFGSVAANVLIIGLIALMRSVPVDLTFSYYVYAAVMVLLLGLLTVFYRTGRAFERREGIALVAVYVLFLIVQSAFLFGD